MFYSLFLSENQKLVKKWKQEHKEIVALANKVIEAYSANNQKAAKKIFKELNKSTVNHLMLEDIELYKLQQDEKRITSEMHEATEEFRRTFRGTKTVLLDFLTKYTQEDALFDDKFFKTLKEIVEVLVKRIAYEENNLYSQLNSN